MDSAETAEDPEDAEAEEKLHFKTGSRRFPRRFKMLCSMWAARCSGVGGPSGAAFVCGASRCWKKQPNLPGDMVYTDVSG